MKPTGKNPFEIRLELLQLANNILQSQHQAKCHGKDIKTAPTSAEVIAEAEKLNTFVSNPNH